MGASPWLFGEHRSKNQVASLLKHPKAPLPPTEKGGASSYPLDVKKLLDTPE